MAERLLRSILFVLAGTVLIVVMPPTAAGAEALWQIGTFDGSSLEFSQAPVENLTHLESHAYIVGKSDPAKDWYAFQPGSSNGKAGRRSYPFTILFDLPSAPKGLYALKVVLLVLTPRVPRLLIEINGHGGLFYQHPNLNYAAGDEAGIILPTYSAANITAELPRSFLKRGTNKLVLTAIDEPREYEDSGGAVTPGNSRIVYDALELDHELSATYTSTKLTAEAVPTIFYKSKNSGLAELVDVFVGFGERPTNGRVTLTVGKQTYAAPLRSEYDFGQQLLEFQVPEFNPAANGEVIVSTRGRRQRFSTPLAPAKKWNLYVVPGAHLDIGYTDYQAKVAEIQSRSIDDAMEMIRDHPDFRFYLDGYWVVEQFLRSRNEEQRQKFLQLVAEKKILVPAQYANLWTGIPTLETLIRSLYGGYKFHVQHGVDFDYANITDVPSYTWSYASVLAAAGLKYFIAACDNYRGPMLLLGRLHEKSPFWWEGPDGGKILMWYSRGYFQARPLFNEPPQVAAGWDSLPIFLQNYTRPEYKSDTVLVYGMEGDNPTIFPQWAAFAEEWNRVYAYPKLRFSGFSEALEHIANQFGDASPVLRGDGGPYWEDGATADAYYAALQRQNEQRALSAEKFSTISSLVNAHIQQSDREALTRLWENMLLMDEHTWESSRSVSDPDSLKSVGQRAVKEGRAVEAQSALEGILERSLAAIADYIYAGSGTLVVFNSLNWQRAGLVEMDLDKGLELVDLTTKQTVPYQVLSTGHAYRHIRFLASDVPSVGYKCYALRRSEAETEVPAVTFETTLESPYYRVLLDPASGAVQSILDKELDRELVDASSPYRFDQYLYVTGADDLPNRLIQYRAVSPLPKLDIHGTSGGRLISVVHAPFGTIARLESSSVNTPRVETDIILFAKQKKIEFINRVHKTKVYTKEGVYFAFPLAMDKPEFLYEIQNGFVNPAQDQLPGAGKEWFTVQHWLAVKQGDLTATIVPVDAHEVTLGDIARGTWPTEFGQRKGTVFSYVMNNYTNTNTVGGQGGDFTFRYVITSGRNFEPSSLSRFGWENMTPLETDEITVKDKTINDTPEPLDSAVSSFLQTDQPNVLFVTWKRAEDGQGTILRFLESAGKPSSVSVTVPLLNVEAAWRCNAMEKAEQSLPVSLHGFKYDVRPFEIVTVRVRGTLALKQTANSGAFPRESKLH